MARRIVAITTITPTATADTTNLVDATYVGVVRAALPPSRTKFMRFNFRSSGVVQLAHIHAVKP